MGPEQLAVVWTLILQSEPEGPTLISCAARLLRGGLLHHNLPSAPSWRTVIRVAAEPVPSAFEFFVEIIQQDVRQKW